MNVTYAEVYEFQCDGCGERASVEAPVAFYRHAEGLLRVGASVGTCNACGELRFLEAYPREKSVYDAIIESYSDDDQLPTWATPEEWTVARAMLAGKTSMYRCLTCGAPQGDVRVMTHACGGTFHLSGLDLADATPIYMDPPVS